MKAVHQAVHSTYTDINAIVTAKKVLNFVGAEPHVVFGTNLQDVGFDGLVLGNTRRDSFGMEMFVVRATVNAEYLAKKIEPVLKAKLVNGGQSLFECGVKIAIAFFKMRFSSSSIALRFCSSLIC